MYFVQPRGSIFRVLNAVAKSLRAFAQYSPGLSPYSTISGKEELQFRRLSSEWWEENGSLKALHSMNFVRVPWIRDALKVGAVQPLRGVNILDVGCGGGILSEPLVRMGAKVVGIDLTAACLTVAEDHRDQVLQPKLRHRLQYYNLSVSDVIGKMTFDAVVASEVIEHVEDQNKFIGDCLSVLAPGGHLFVTTLNRTQMSRMLGVYAAEYILGIVPAGTHDWDSFVTPEEMHMMIKEHGGNVCMTHGLGYSPLTNQWTWKDNQLINYAIHAVKQS